MLLLLGKIEKQISFYESVVVVSSDAGAMVQSTETEATTTHFLAGFAYLNISRNLERRQPQFLCESRMRILA